MSPFPAGFPIKDLILEDRSFVDHKQQAVSALMIEHAKHVDTAAVPGGPQSVADLSRSKYGPGFRPWWGNRKRYTNRTSATIHPLFRTP
jgi:hypothetical protein